MFTRGKVHTHERKNAHGALPPAKCSCSRAATLTGSEPLRQSRDSMKISPPLFIYACMYEMSCAFSFVAKSVSNPDLTDQCCVYILRP